VFQREPSKNSVRKESVFLIRARTAILCLRVILPLEVKETESEYSQKAKAAAAWTYRTGVAVFVSLVAQMVGVVHAFAQAAAIRSAPGASHGDGVLDGGALREHGYVVAALVCSLGRFGICGSRANRRTAKAAKWPLSPGLVLDRPFVAGGADQQGSANDSGGAATISSQAAVVTFSKAASCVFFRCPCRSRVVQAPELTASMAAAVGAPAGFANWNRSWQSVSSQRRSVRRDAGPMSCRPAVMPSCPGLPASGDRARSDIDLAAGMTQGA